MTDTLKLPIVDADEVWGLAECGLLLADGFEDAFVGIAGRFGWVEPVAVYSYDRCIDVLMRDGASYAECAEHFEYNVIGAYAGPQTPIFIRAVTLGDVHKVAQD